MPKPVIKWVGGKQKLVPTLLQLLPTNVEELRHVEPFVGGGALFFARSPNLALLADTNAHLINLYNQLQSNFAAVLEALQSLAAKHDPSQDALYYLTRAKFNAAEDEESDPVQQAARFVYLNKTGFNGLYRVNSKGLLNTPAGKHKHLTIVDRPTLEQAREALQSAELQCTDFAEVCARVGQGDFVYLDPPYAPGPAGSTFVAYSKGGFTYDDHERLKDAVVGMSRRGAKIMLSNSDVGFVRDLYKDFNLKKVNACRSVSRDGEGRKPVQELIVRNYE